VSEVPLHQIFAEGSAPVKAVENIGNGRLGPVDKVEFIGKEGLPGKVYARKVMRIGPPRDASIMSNRVAYLAVERSFKHEHLVSIVQTYQEDVRVNALLCYGIIMSPVGDCTLRSILESAKTSHKPDYRHSMLLLKWFGCIGSALSYLHANDISNCRITSYSYIVKNDAIFLTEFTISNSLENTYLLGEGNYTAPSPSQITYQPPEFRSSQICYLKLDVFSLGCVFLEMLTVLADMPIATLYKQVQDDKASPTSNLQKRIKWLEDIQTQLSTNFLEGMAACCEAMLEYDPQSRLSAYRVARFASKMISEETRTVQIQLRCECLDPWKMDAK
jgi:serine/threonine protein kinase